MSVGEYAGNQPLRRLKTSWDDNIKVDIRKISCIYEKQIELIQDGVQWL